MAQLEVRKSIVCKFLENPNLSGRSIGKVLKLPQKTVSRVIKNFKESQSIERKPDSRRRRGPANQELQNKIIRSFKQNPGLSDGDRAQRYGTSASNVRNVRLRGGYKSYHAIKTPNRTHKQSLVARKRARLLHRDVLTKMDGHILLDDETYVKMDFKQMPGQTSSRQI